MVGTNLLDIDHDKAINLRILLLVKSAVCERHDGGMRRPWVKWEFDVDGEVGTMPRVFLKFGTTW